MKKLAAIAGVLALAASASAQTTVFELTFDNAPLGAADLPYNGYAGDTIPANTAVNTSDPSGPGDPDILPGTIVDTTGLGFAGTAQGGRALSLDGSQGYYVSLDVAEELTSDYSVELVVAFTEYPGASAEFGITNIIGTAPPTNNHYWEIRGLGQFGAPVNEFELMTQVTGEIKDDTDFVPALNTWYTFLLEFEKATNTLTLSIDGIVSATVQNNEFGAEGLRDFCLGFWPNDADSNRNLVGAIDSITVVDLTSNVSDWSMF